MPDVVQHGIELLRKVARDRAIPLQRPGAGVLYFHGRGNEKGLNAAKARSPLRLEPEPGGKGLNTPLEPFELRPNAGVEPGGDIHFVDGQRPVGGMLIRESDDLGNGRLDLVEEHSEVPALGLSELDGHGPGTEG